MPRSAGQFHSVEAAASFTLSFGGLPDALANMAESLRNNTNCVPHVAAFNAPYQPLYSKSGLQVTRFPLSRRLWLLSCEWRSKLELLVASADLCHVHGLWQVHSNYTAASSRRHKKPYLISPHGMLDDWALQQKRTKKWLYSAVSERATLRRAQCLRALTTLEAENFRRFGLKNAIAIIPNGVDLPQSISSDLFFGKFPHLTAKMLILFLGRIHPKKGLANLCRLWPRIAHDYPAAHLVIAGPDFENTRSSLEGFLRSASAADSTTFTGMLTGEMKRSALGAATGFILPSYSEGFSVAILEALASSLPVIATNQCNFPEIATAGCGWLCEPEEASVEKALRQLLEATAEERARVGARGLRLVQSRYTRRAIAAQVADLYQYILGGTIPTSFEMRQ